MKRRRRNTGPLPAHLATFDPEDWPGLVWEECFTQWRTALAEHAKTYSHPDIFEQLMLAIWVRRRHRGQLLPPGVAVHFGVKR